MSRRALTPTLFATLCDDAIKNLADLKAGYRAMSAAARPRRQRRWMDRVNMSGHTDPTGGTSVELLSQMEEHCDQIRAIRAELWDMVRRYDEFRPATQFPASRRCGADDCAVPADKAGLCNKHYMRMYRASREAR